MGIAEEYAKRYKTPIIRVTLTRFVVTQKPGVDTPGNNYFPEVISCDITHGFTQGVSTCSLTIKTPLDASGEYVVFKPMDRIKVEQGWNYRSTLETTFFGFVDAVERATPPKTQRLECRDILKLASDNYYIKSNRKVYSAVVDDGELDEEGDPMGGQDVEDRQAQAIIATFLIESGIPESRHQLDFPEYPASGAIIIGNNSTAVFVYESALDGITRICDLLRFRVWSDPAGMIQVREVRPIASETSSVAYRTQEEVYQGGESWSVTAGNIIEIDADVVDEVRNWIEVVGYTDDIKATYVGESPYIPDPPRYRKVEIKSYLLDTQELVEVVASGIIQDLNRLRYTSRVRIEGDPRIKIGSTVEVYDPYVTPDGATNYFLSDISSRFVSGNWTMELGLVGGEGEGSAAIGNISPIAVFDYRTELEVLSDGLIWTDVLCDATPSYDPDGSKEDLSYLWTCSGFADQTGLIATYLLSDTGSIVVTLKVTDSGSPPLDDTLERSILIEPGEMMQEKTIWIASGKNINLSTDGGQTWLQQTLF